MVSSWFYPMTVISAAYANCAGVSSWRRRILKPWPDKITIEHYSTAEELAESAKSCPFCAIFEDTTDYKFLPSAYVGKLSSDSKVMVLQLWPGRPSDSLFNIHKTGLSCLKGGKYQKLSSQRGIHQYTIRTEGMLYEFPLRCRAVTSYIV
jgi:hypothetical protein